MTLEKKPLGVEKQAPETLTPMRGFTRELDLLYQRRAVVVNLIQSLEAYDRYHRVTSMDARRRKTA